MATVKRKHTRARSRKRRSGHRKLAQPTIRTCPKCGDTMMSHRLCPSCGTYRGRSIAEKSEV